VAVTKEARLGIILGTNTLAFCPFVNYVCEKFCDIGPRKDQVLVFSARWQYNKKYSVKF
jgi:hypothetical protein